MKGHTAVPLRLPQYPRSAGDAAGAGLHRAGPPARRGDPFDQVIGFPPGHSCMVVPLCAGEKTYGVLTLDRQVCETYSAAGGGPGGGLRADAGHRHPERGARRPPWSGCTSRTTRTRAAGGAAPRGEMGASWSPVASASVRELARRARQVAQTDTPVLVPGETGPARSGWRGRCTSGARGAEHPFVTLNCAAIPAGLLESELFGHVKGAFTGAPGAAGPLPDGQRRHAAARRDWRAAGGASGQAAAASFRRGASSRWAATAGKVDVRILAATHRGAGAAIARARFREDLYYRLNVFPLAAAPAARAAGGSPAAVRVPARGAGAAHRAPGVRVGRKAWRSSGAYGWPGNIRELANVAGARDHPTLGAGAGAGGARRPRRRSEGGPAPPGLAPRRLEPPRRAGPGAHAGRGAARSHLKTCWRSRAAAFTGGAARRSSWGSSRPRYRAACRSWDRTGPPSLLIAAAAVTQNETWLEFDDGETVTRRHARPPVPGELHRGIASHERAQRGSLAVRGHHPGRPVHDDRAVSGHRRRRRPRSSGPGCPSWD